MTKAWGQYQLLLGPYYAGPAIIVLVRIAAKRLGQWACNFAAQLSWFLPEPIQCLKGKEILNL